MTVSARWRKDIHLSLANGARQDVAMVTGPKGEDREVWLIV